jgi:uncharacterized membrane protein
MNRRVIFKGADMKVKLYFVALLFFLAIDSLWLGFIAPNFYRAQIGHLMAEQPNLMAAGIFYLLFIAGLLVFVLEPGLQNPSPWSVGARGAFFGLVTYATYDLTNLATLAGWPLWLTGADLLWGTFLSAVVTLLTIWTVKQLKST